MTTLFVGAGYTGARVMERLPDAIALGRSRPGEQRLDLDSDSRLRLELPERYAVIYSVPPAPDQPGDPRLGRFLASTFWSIRYPHLHQFLSTINHILHHQQSLCCRLRRILHQ